VTVMDATPQKRADDVIFEVTGGRAVLLDAAGTELITLNAVGTLVWQGLDGRRTSDQLAADLHARFEGVTREDLANDIAAFVAELKASGLVVDAQG